MDSSGELLLAQDRFFRRAAAHARAWRPAACRPPERAGTGKSDGELFREVREHLLAAAPGLLAVTEPEPSKPLRPFPAGEVVAVLCKGIAQEAAISGEIEAEHRKNTAPGSGSAGAASRQAYCRLVGVHSRLVSIYRQLIEVYSLVQALEDRAGPAAGAVLRGIVRVKEAIGGISILAQRFMHGPGGDEAGDDVPGAGPQTAYWEESGLRELFQEVRDGMKRAAGKLHLAYGLMGSTNSPGGHHPGSFGYSGGYAQTMLYILTVVDMVIPLLDALEEKTREMLSVDVDRKVFLYWAGGIVQAVDGNILCPCHLEAAMEAGSLVNAFLDDRRQHEGSVDAYCDGEVVLLKVINHSIMELENGIEDLRLAEGGEEGGSEPDMPGSILYPEDLFGWAEAVIDKVDREGMELKLVWTRPGTETEGEGQ